MRAKNLRIKMQFHWGQRHLVPPDDLNNTQLCVNGQIVWPLSAGFSYDGFPLDIAPPFDTMSIETGDEISLEIPSGRLEGIVTEKMQSDDGSVFIWLKGGEWEGRAGGLAGGLSGCATFEIMNGAPTYSFYTSYDNESDSPALVVESSAINDIAIPLDIYELVRLLANYSIASDGRSASDKPSTMKALFEVLGY